MCLFSDSSEFNKSWMIRSDSGEGQASCSDLIAFILQENVTENNRGTIRQD